MTELIMFGILTGFISGFFGLGGGIILVPLLLISGYIMKQAIAISIMQMVFSSIYGSFLNSKNSNYIFKDGIILGIGGFFGGLQNSFIHSFVSDETLKYIFIAIIIFSLVKIFFSSTQSKEKNIKDNKIILFITGFFVGAIAMSIGVGGAVLLIPILVGFIKYPIKIATSLSLFFVIFSSVAGFTSFSINGLMPYKEGLLVGLPSLIGVYFGIKMKISVSLISYILYLISRQY